MAVESSEPDLAFAEPTSTSPLPYAGTDTLPILTPAWRTVAMRIVLVCWAIPLAAGLFIFSAAVARRDDPDVWITAGLWDIGIGVVLSIAGGIALLAFMAQRWAPAKGIRLKLLVVPAVVGAALLASNYLIAFGMIYAAILMLR